MPLVTHPENRGQSCTACTLPTGPRRHAGHTAEGDWVIDVFEETYSELVQYPLEERCKAAGKEEDEAIVELELTMREQTLWPQ